jgi:antitoxin YefM
MKKSNPFIAQSANRRKSVQNSVISPHYFTDKVNLCKWFCCAITCTIITMQAITYSEARNNLASHLDRVVWDSDYTVITRQKAEPAVLMSLRDYEAMQETIFLLSRGNAPRLLDAVNDIKQRRKLQTHALVEA